MERQYAKHVKVNERTLQVERKYATKAKKKKKVTSYKKRDEDSWKQEGFTRRCNEEGDVDTHQGYSVRLSVET